MSLSSFVQRFLAWGGSLQRGNCDLSQVLNNGEWKQDGQPWIAAAARLDSSSGPLVAAACQEEKKKTGKTDDVYPSRLYMRLKLGLLVLLSAFLVMLQ